MSDKPHILVIGSVTDRTEKSLFAGIARSPLFETDVILDPKQKEREEIKATGATIIDMYIKHRFHLKSILALRKLIKERHYSVIFTTYNRGLSIAMLATHGLPCKVVGYRGTMGNITRWDPGCWVAHLHPRIRMISCNCEAVKKSLLGVGLPPHKLITIYKGHRPEWYQGDEKPALSEFNIPEGSFIVGCIANFRELKGIDYIIKAFAELRDLPVHLILVGKNDNPKYQKLIEKLNLSDKIHFAGYRSDAVKVNRIFNVSIMASTRREGLPRSIVESMAQGIPAIVTNIGGMPELVQDKINGLVIPPKDSHAIASAIRTLYNDREMLKTFGENAVNWIKTTFNADKALETYLALFKKLTEEENGKEK